MLLVRSPKMHDHLSHLLATSFPLNPHTFYTFFTRPLLHLTRTLKSALRTLNPRVPRFPVFPRSWPTTLARWLRPLYRLLPGLSPSTRYPTPAAEQAYWAVSARWRRALFASDARSCEPPPCLTPVPLITSYVPRLLPRYRDNPVEDAESVEYTLSPATFRKWHRMVYPDRKPPSLRQASSLLRQHSSRDKREMARIAALPPARGRPAGLRYNKMWKEWLERKGPDCAIVFE